MPGVAFLEQPVYWNSCKANSDINSYHLSFFLSFSFQIFFSKSCQKSRHHLIQKIQILLGLLCNGWTESCYLLNSFHSSLWDIFLSRKSHRYDVLIEMAT